MGNIPVHPDEAARAAFYAEHGINRMEELRRWLDDKSQAEHEAIAAEGMFGLFDPETILPDEEDLLEDDDLELIDDDEAGEDEDVRIARPYGSDPSDWAEEDE